MTFDDSEPNRTLECVRVGLIAVGYGEYIVL